ncbi:MAG: hypothetical protein JWP20_2358 [Roseomonas sp.]|nr:hypothetical protein [Roseomonas sp.]
MPPFKACREDRRPVGNARANASPDVLWAKDALACLGRYPRGVKQRHGYIGRACIRRSKATSATGPAAG